jgi:hypothetical protein
MRQAVFVLMIAAGAPTAAFCQTLQDQINSVYQVQQRQEEAQGAEHEAQQAAAQDERRKEIAAQRARAAADEARRRQQAAEAEAEKKRDQAYQDRLRDLNIQRQELELQAAKGAVARENEYINSDLARKAAETDVIKSQAARVQSEADANRNISTGIKSYLDQSGRAEIQRSAPQGSGTLSHRLIESSPNHAAGVDVQ